MSGINAKQFRLNIVRSILKSQGLWSPAAEELLMGTAAHESHLGEYIIQLENGPAVGLYQMEPVTYHDIRTYVVFSPKVSLTFNVSMNAEDMIWDLRLATVMCRLAYWRHSEPLPDSNDISGLAEYWKKYYNTVKGKGTVEEFKESYRIRVQKTGGRPCHY